MFEVCARCVTDTNRGVCGQKTPSKEEEEEEVEEKERVSGYSGLVVYIVIEKLS